MPPKAPRPGDRPNIDPRQLQGRLFGESDMGELAIKGDTIVPTREGGPGGFPITPLDTAELTAGTLAIPAEVATEVAALDFRYKAIKDLASEARAAGRAEKATNNMNKLNARMGNLRDAPFDQDKREKISSSLNAENEKRTRQEHAERQKRRDAKQAFASSIGIETEVIELPKTDEPNKTYKKVVPVEKDDEKREQLQVELERRFEEFWRSYGGRGKSRNSVRVKERRRIESAKASLLSKALHPDTKVGSLADLSDLTAAVRTALPKKNR